MNSAGYLPKATPPSHSLPFQIGNASRHSRACPACPACPEPAAAGGQHGRGELAEWERPAGAAFLGSRVALPEEGALPMEVASHSALATSHCNSNRYTLRIESPVTPTKQTAVVLSNRYKKPSPREVPPGLPPCPALRSSNRNTPETGIAVTYSKQTVGSFSNRYKKPSPRGVPNLQPPGLLECAQGRGTMRAKDPRQGTLLSVPNATATGRLQPLRPQGLKPLTSRHVSARLKPCPDERRNPPSPMPVILSGAKNPSSSLFRAVRPKPKRDSSAQLAGPQNDVRGRDSSAQTPGPQNDVRGRLSRAASV
jgi:hypothetical protein